CHPARQKRILASAARFADAELASTPDLLESATRARHFPVAADLAAYPFQLPTGAPKLVLHAPTNRLIKGTRYVEAAFEALRPRFPHVRFETVERMPWHALRDLMAEADVVVDQVFMGWYGMVAVEAMAMGKPVLCFVRDDFEKYLRECPIVRCTKDDLQAPLAHVLGDGFDRVAAGEAGRAYVAREHDAAMLARQLIALYAEIGAGSAPAAASASGAAHA